VSATAEPPDIVEVTSSPICPVFALSFVVVPTIATPPPVAPRIGLLGEAAPVTVILRVEPAV